MLEGFVAVCNRANTTIAENDVAVDVVMERETLRTCSKHTVVKW